MWAQRTPQLPAETVRHASARPSRSVRTGCARSDSRTSLPVRAESASRRCNLGGESLATTFSLQSGSPFTVLDGSDPTGAQAGISGLVGLSIRPNLDTDLPLSKMTIPEILAAGGAGLFRPLCGN